MESIVLIQSTVSSASRVSFQAVHVEISPDNSRQVLCVLPNGVRRTILLTDTDRLSVDVLPPSPPPPPSAPVEPVPEDKAEKAD